VRRTERLPSRIFCDVEERKGDWDKERDVNGLEILKADRCLG
jgi:hypothetical protein